MLTPREIASHHYTRFCSIGRKGVFGRPINEVNADRLTTAVQAENAIRRAQDGPPRHYYAEPDDTKLAAMLTAVLARRSELETALQNAPNHE
ncbi:hypothetical protein ACFYUD_03750 [Nocardia tengchongensis]|uniref:hypothetical protein n=1 Tax=Nocardia tengchongensis TaxID=2055889 RepID=UPI003693C4AB